MVDFYILRTNAGFTHDFEEPQGEGWRRWLTSVAGTQEIVRLAPGEVVVYVYHPLLALPEFAGDPEVCEMCGESFFLADDDDNLRMEEIGESLCGACHRSLRREIRAVLMLR